MTEDQKYALDSFKRILKEEKPDVLVIAGDIYDRSVPPVEAVELLDEFLSETLIDLDIKVIAIAGNHDSPDRLSFGNKILEKRGLHIKGLIDKEIEPIVFEDEYGKINFYPIPYGEPVIIRNILEDDSVKTHEDVYRVITEKIYEKMNREERNIAIAHAFLGGTVEPERSESERRLSIGGSDMVSVELFKDFDYTALGHIHKPQKVKYENIRYSGSLLKYSFSEHNQRKSVTILDIGEKGNINITQREIEKIRDMRQIKGELADLISPEVYSYGNQNDYIMAVLTDKGEVVDAIGKLRAVYPNVLRIEREERQRSIENERTSAGADFVKRGPMELFEEFYKNIVGEELEEEKKSVIESVVDEINLEGRELK